MKRSRAFWCQLAAENTRPPRRPWCDETIRQLSRAPGQRTSPPGCHGAIIERTRRLSSPSPTGTTVTSAEILQGTGERHVGTVPLDGAGIQGARTPMPRRRKAQIESRGQTGQCRTRRGQAQSAPGVAPVLAFAQAPRQECPRAAVSQSSVDAERCRKANPHDTRDKPLMPHEPAVSG